MSPAAERLTRVMVAQDLRLATRSEYLAECYRFRLHVLSRYHYFEATTTRKGGQ